MLKHFDVLCSCSKEITVHDIHKIIKCDCGSIFHINFIPNSGYMILGIHIGNNPKNNLQILKAC